jgi:hypothetical protein
MFKLKIRSFYRYYIATLGLSAAAFPMLRLADKISKYDALVWSSVFLLWFFINLLYLRKSKIDLLGRNVISFNFIFWILILSIILFISGIRFQDRYRFWHTKSESVTNDLRRLFQGHTGSHMYRRKSTTVERTGNISV